LPSQHNVGPSPISAQVSKDGAVLFDVDSDRLLKLNTVAAEMWRQLDAGNSETQIIESIARQYGVDKQRVAADLGALLERTAELGIAPGRSRLMESQPAAPENAAMCSRFRSGQAEDSRNKVPAWAIFCAVLGLAIFDLILWAASFKWLCRAVQKWPLKRRTPQETLSVVGQLCGAVEEACVWYPKKALCLQRSAVTACLLRSLGIDARMVIGARPMPFLAHAWVEVNGCVVNDVSRVKQFYHSLVSC
jgi:hypothetical protein